MGRAIAIKDEVGFASDTWQMVLRRLVGQSDAVLMDLRGFTRTSKGCIFELHELLDAVPLKRVPLRSVVSS
ncbi:MAG: hypothetical protein WBM01_04475 [Mycobacterium sp.]|uniref:hypothetical protein n=1 Tax=Mycobacterium sp. TaxID=1785 RepID=UPI003C773C6D